MAMYERNTRMWANLSLVVTLVALVAHTTLSLSLRDRWKDGRVSMKEWLLISIGYERLCFWRWAAKSVFYANFYLIFPFSLFTLVFPAILWFYHPHPSSLLPTRPHSQMDEEKMCQTMKTMLEELNLKCLEATQATISAKITALAEQKIRVGW